MSEEMRPQLVRAFKDLRLGSLLALLSDILLIASFLPLLMSMPTIFWRISRQEAQTSLRDLLVPMMPMAVSALALALAALVLGLVGLYLWYRASSSFKLYDEAKFSLGRIGAAMSIAGTLVLAISLAAIFYFLLSLPPRYERPPEWGIRALAALLPGVAGLLLGVIVYVIGWILYGIMVMRLSEIPGLSQDFRYAGILMIAGTVLSMLGSLGVIGVLVEMASLIMIFVYSDTAIKGLSPSQ